MYWVCLVFYLQNFSRQTGNYLTPSTRATDSSLMAALLVSSYLLFRTEPLCCPSFRHIPGCLWQCSGQCWDATGKQVKLAWLSRHTNKSAPPFLLTVSSNVSLPLSPPHLSFLQAHIIMPMEGKALSWWRERYLCHVHIDCNRSSVTMMIQPRMTHPLSHQRLHTKSM